MPKKNVILVVFAIFALANASIFPVSAVDTLNASDFKLESWSKTVDFFEYARQYAEQHGKMPPSAGWHANLYLTYVNTSGLQMLYGGLVNITMNQATLTIPIQTIMMRYKSQNGSKDIVTASSFIMLLAFNESTSTIHPNSPDKNDTLYSSFNLGFDLSSKFEGVTPPALNSKTTIIPLTSSPDKTSWHWGMKYTNLTAIWWKTYIDPSNPHHDALPIAVTRYDELTFTYNLTLNTTDGTATLTSNYVIGKMTDLWVIWWFFIIPFTVHYNSTGCYRMNGAKYSNETIYEFLESQGIQMSIVQFQSTVMLDHTAFFKSHDFNVTDSDVYVSNSTISGFADDGERIFDASFGSKRSYNLYNYTEDPTETSYKTYNTTTRTCKIAGFAHNGIFNVHTSLMRFIPLVIAHMDPALYQRAKDHLLDMTYADYFYLISYPTYSGYRVEHDPILTAYYAPMSTATIPTFPTGLILFAVVIAVIAIGAAVVLRRHRSKQPKDLQQSDKTNQPPPPPSS